MICKGKNCVFEINSTNVSLSGRYCCVKCKEGKGHGAFCKKKLAKCCNPSCEFKCHPDLTISGGTHCCNACRMQSGHGPACKFLIHSIKKPDPLISSIEVTNSIFPEKSP